MYRFLITDVSHIKQKLTFPVTAPIPTTIARPCDFHPIVQNSDPQWIVSLTGLYRYREFLLFLGG